MREHDRPRPRIATCGHRTLRAVALTPLLVACASVVAITGCESVPTAPPSTLAQTVTAMDRGEWERANELLAKILPPPPEIESDEVGGGETLMASSDD